MLLKLLLTAAKLLLQLIPPLSPGKAKRTADGLMGIVFSSAELISGFTSAASAGGDAINGKGTNTDGWFGDCTG
jgi:hypothetical protein